MSQVDVITELLQGAGMRRTAPRQHLLEQLLKSEHALSHQDLERNLKGTVDRVTIYRILSAFEERGVIHKVNDTTGVAKYALCSSACGEAHHHDEHIHFHCTQCGKTFCLEESDFPQVKLPRNFRLERLEVNARGICESCRN